MAKVRGLESYVRRILERAVRITDWTLEDPFGYREIERKGRRTCGGKTIASHSFSCLGADLTTSERPKKKAVISAGRSV